MSSVVALDFDFLLPLVCFSILHQGNETVISLRRFVKFSIPGSMLTGVPSRNTFSNIRYFLKGSCTKLFFIKVCFKDDDETMIGEVYLFKLDTTSKTFKEMEDLKDNIFLHKYVSDNSYSIFYKSGVTTEIGGYVHILGEIDNIIHSFYIKDRTMSLSSMPCIVRESQVLVWAMLECRLEVDHRESTQEKEQDKDIEIVIRPFNAEFDSTTSESHLLNVPFHILEMIMEHCVGVEYMRYRGIITFKDPIRGGKYFIKTPHELEGDYRIYCSSLENLLRKFKLNDSTRKWEKLDGLGKHMIYISDISCVCLEAKSPQMGNKIYFPRFLKNEKIVFYSLETCSNNYFLFLTEFGSPRALYPRLSHLAIKAFTKIHKSKATFLQKSPILYILFPSHTKYLSISIKISINKNPNFISAPFSLLPHSSQGGLLEHHGYR
ncbi:hypothetical protein L1987_31084 [Smallanthus sonchifolius]|uniref:Uncharacterized protein n=1 Tax=Smallanthus sonchifolius TaxID=185202 RepID=A0ACB9I576_9ASTR|nr:hypothetical protein L1987_31084 [Smallanthus sonchifolius]